MEKRLKRSNPEISARIRKLRKEVESAFGASTRLLRMIVGPVLLWTSKREDRRLAAGVTYEPQTFIERHNWVEESGEGARNSRWSSWPSADSVLRWKTSRPAWD